VNDTSAGRFDPEMAGVVAAAGVPVVLMHSRERPSTMQQQPSYADVLAEVEHELLAQVAVFRNAGVAEGNVVLDPGIGFAKRLEDNLGLLGHVERLAALGYPLLVGTSRKSFLGLVTGRPVEQRLAGSLGSVAAAYARGVRLFRVHDVAETVDLLKVLVAVDAGAVAKGR
jgi:dihydropteroate synthase